MKSLQVIIPVVFLAVVLGCTQPAGFSRHTLSRFDQAAPDVVYQAAEATMREYFRIDRSDPRSGVIRSEPAEEVLGGDNSLAFSSRRRIRRVAELRIEPQGTAVLARCQVLIEHTEPTRVGLFAGHRSADDVPNQTPLEENQGIDPAAGLIWTHAGYDHRLESQMLAALAERLEARRQEPGGRRQ